MKNISRLVVLTALAILVFYLPYYLTAPLKWYETFFHELSHGLAAMLTGGSIETIDIKFKGSGTCWTRGGIGPLVTFAGYTGASLWGALIYMSAATVNYRTSHILASIILITIIITTILWVRDIQTLIIMLAMGGILSLTLKFGKSDKIKLFVEFIGLYILLASIQSPTFLIDGINKGDGASMAKQTLLPEAIWVGIWLAWSIGLLLFLYYRTYSNNQKSSGFASA